MMTGCKKKNSFKEIYHYIEQYLQLIKLMSASNLKYCLPNICQIKYLDLYEN